MWRCVGSPRCAIVLVAHDVDAITAKTITAAAKQHRRRVYLVKDKPHSLVALRRARLHTARAVLVLRQHPPRRPVDDADFFFVDKLAIFTALLIDNKFRQPRQLTPRRSLLCVTEIMNDNNVQFLREFEDIRTEEREGETLRTQSKRANMTVALDMESTRREAQVVLPDEARRRIMLGTTPLTSRYAAGQLIGSSIVTSIFAQALFKPVIIKFMTDLAAGRQKCIRQMDVSTLSAPPPDDAARRASDEAQVSSYVGKSYGDLVEHCVTALKLTPLGLFRKDTSNPQLQYTASNPRRDTLLRQGDFVFLLSR